METVIAIATAWGVEHGGVNSFNMDFVAALGVAFSSEFQVVCCVERASLEQISEAHRSGVRLVSPTAEMGFGFSGIRHACGSFNGKETVWIGHDVFTGELAIELARETAGRSAVFAHVSYAAYKPFETGSASGAKARSERQQRIFRSADFLFAVGPMLRDEVADLVQGRKPIMVVPGLPDIEPAMAPNRLTTVLFGRLNPETDRVKQGRLGIAAFARACRGAIENPGMPAALQDRPRLKLFGIDATEEKALREFADKEAQGVLDFHPLPFETERRALFSELAHSSLALMPSWHEGFGLAGWEAIGAGIPLILSDQSGVYKYLNEFLPGAGRGCVEPVRILGHESDSTPYQPSDVEAVSAAIIRVAANPTEARKRAAMLRELLKEKTWASCAASFIETVAGDAEQDVTTSPRAISDIEPLPEPGNQSTEVLGIPPPLWRPNSGHADSVLLQAEEVCVPFDSRRDRLVLEIEEWATSRSGFPLMVRLFVGPGGVGKTRAMLEVCKRLSGWKAGFILQGGLTDTRARFERILGTSERVFGVVDYAETRRGIVADLISAAAQSRHPQVRIVLLAREAGDWWDELPNDFPATAHILAGTATSGPFLVAPMYSALEDRAEAYDGALTALARRTGVAREKVRSQPDLSADEFGYPLYLQMAALLALRGESATTVNGLTDGILRHEERYWTAIGASLGTSSGAQISRHLLGLATLAGEIITAKDAGRLYQESGGPEHAKPLVAAIFKGLCQLYPGGRGLQPLRPDTLGEALVARLNRLTDDSDPLWSCLLGSSSSEFVRNQTLTVFTRLARRRPAMQETLASAVRAHFVACAGSVLSVAQQTGEPLPEIAVAEFAALPHKAKSAVAGVLQSRLGAETVRLGLFLLQIAQSLRDRAQRSWESRKTDQDRALDYAKAEDRLAMCLARVGQFEAALAAVEAASIVAERLAEKNSRRFSGLLAGILGNKGIRLHELGRINEALACVQRALTMYDALEASSPGGFRSQCAIARGNISNLLSELGRYEEAVERARESLELREQLHTKERSDESEADLALALGQFASRLQSIGNVDEALVASSRSLEIRERLAKKLPDRYEPAHTTSLATHASVMDAIGKSDESLVLIERAVEIATRLASLRPDRHQETLARALDQLGNSLAEAGRVEDAVARAEQGHRIIEALFAIRRERHHDDFASSLVNLGNHYAQVGRFDEAFQFAHEADLLVSELVARAPLRFAQDRTTTLHNLASALARLGRHREALDCALEELAIARQIAEQLPLKYESDLAAALERVADAYAEVGSFAPALQFAREASDAWERLDQRRPLLHRRFFASAKLTLAWRLADNDLFAEAASEARQSNDLFVDLHSKRPASHAEGLAGARLSCAFFSLLAHPDLVVIPIEDSFLSSLPKLRQGQARIENEFLSAISLFRTNREAAISRMANVVAAYERLPTALRAELEKIYLVSTTFIATHRSDDESSRHRATKCMSEYIEKHGENLSGIVVRLFNVLECQTPS